MFSLSSIPSTTAVLSAYTTVAASTVLVKTLFNEIRNMANQLIPQELQQKILTKLGFLLTYNSSQMCIVIDELTNAQANNEVFEAAELYLQKKITSSVNKLKVSKASGENSLSVVIDKGEEIEDIFNGIHFVWKMISIESQKKSADYDGFFCTETGEHRSFQLCFDKKYHETALTCYLFHVLERSKVMKEANRVVTLQSLGDHYGSVVLNHPSTFDTLAMDPILKKALIDDLNRFVERRDYYKRVGRAWKRGYLLYGPPGTGKSSLVAAMANYLKFDIYDMELASMRNNGNFRNLLVSTKNKSIIVIEDIDCSIDLENREVGGSGDKDSQVTLSGLLNFIDGLWSSCGDERIIVFTTNHKDRLDPALLRPGRMDMHINMSYCTPSGFRILASNYLGITKHEKFVEIEKLLKDVEVTPADIAEQFMRNNETDIALEGLIKFLNTKKTEQSKQNVEAIEAKNGRNEEVANLDVAGKVKTKRKTISGAKRRYKNKIK